MYVGLTRAKDHLFLTYAFIRTRYGESEPSTPSTFLEDIPPELISGAWRQPRRVAPLSATTWRPVPPPPRPAPPRFRPGQRVQHTTFGEGMVTDSMPDGGDQIVTVVFEDVGEKRLSASVAPLTLLSE